jgi:predicted ferric reductase
MSKGSDTALATWNGILRILLYVFAVLAGLAVVTFLRPDSNRGFLYTLGLGTGLVGFGVLAMQAVLAARFHWIERPFGLDQVFRFHKAMAFVAVVLLLVHPVLLAWGSGNWTLLWGLALPWNIWLGKLALLALVVQWFISQFRERMHFEFQKWRLSHNALAVSILVLVFLHSYFSGQDLAQPAMRVLWPVALLAVAVVYVHHKLIRSMLRRKHPYEVVEVTPETPNVTTVKLAPPTGQGRYDYLPGQFQFITFHCEDPEVPVEEHHWTISSTPTEEGSVTSTIKASGDFSAKVPKIRPGDTADVVAPYGRFSYVLHPHEKSLVMIAGGIGITPIMAMIRHMRDTEADGEVLLLYANRTEQDIIFRKELEEIASSGHPRLSVVHVLSRPDESWQGPSGHIDAEVIAQHVGQVEGKAFYVCAPAKMTDAVTGALLRLGVPATRIHTERFSL